MFISVDAKRVIDRLQKMQANTSPKSPKMREAFTRIGLLLTARTKLNVLRQRLIDKGGLRRSINYRLIPDGVEAGSFGVPYAGVYEYGFKGRVRVRSFERTSQLGRSYTVRSHHRNMNVRKRPYLRPAVLASREEIIEILRSSIVS